MATTAVDSPNSAMHAQVERSMLHDVASAELADLCGVVNAAHGRMVEVVADALAAEVWAGAGIHTPRHWVSWQTGMAPGSAANLVRLAERRDELPATLAALGEGRIGLDCAGLIARYVPSEYELCAVEFALVMTLSQLRRTVSQYHFDLDHGGHEDDASPPDPPAEEADAPPSDSAQTADSSASSAPGADDSTSSDGAGDGADSVLGDRRLRRGEPLEERRDLSSGSDLGTFWLSAHLPVDEGAVVRAALEARRDDLYRQACEGLAPDDPRPTVTLADALVSMAESVLAGGDALMPGTDRYLIHAHLSAGGDGRNDLQLHLGASLPHHLRHLHTCDGTIRPTLEVEGTPVSVGRLQRIVSRRLRRLIEHRDGGCAVPGCDRRSGLQIHHIVHWEHGGLTTTDNLLTLCRHHHRAHHLGHLGIEGDADRPRTAPDGVTFTDRWGRVMAPAAIPVPPPPDEPPRTTARRLGLRPQPYDHALGERLDHWGVQFTPNRHMPPLETILTPTAGLRSVGLGGSARSGRGSQGGAGRAGPRSSSPR